MKKHLVRAVLGVVLVAFIQPLFACELSFGVDGESVKYSYAKISNFIREKIRENVKQTSNELERYRVVITDECSPSESEKTVSAKLTIQKNTIYLKELNDAPLCKESMTSKGLRCEKGKYNFVDYQGGANLSIDELAIKKSLRVIAGISTVSEMEDINANSVRKQEVHNAIRLFAMLLAESARFDYVLDDIDCAIKEKGAIHFMDYWILVHNWGTIASLVTNEAPAMELPTTHKGGGNLFVPITREMVTFFNKKLLENPPSSKDTTTDGKNKTIPSRALSCDLNSITEEQIEIDEIYSLLSMAMVEKDWQMNALGRGHNIGSVLVNSEQTPVFYARNSIRQRDNSTQHGEVRLIENYLNCPKVEKYIDGYTVYTTLEPCAMCSGMIAMTKASRVVYVQQDPAYGHTLDALNSIHYPRQYQEYTPINMTEKKSIEAAFDTYKQKTGSSSITDFLLSNEARMIFQSAKIRLTNYSVKFTNNSIVLNKAIEFLAKVTSEKYDAEMLLNCPVLK